MSGTTRVPVPRAVDKYIPAEVAYLLSEQLDSAMQIIAALVFTDDEVRAVRLQGEEKASDQALRGWAKDMREEMLSPAWRARLVEAVSAQGFLTNTHPGFPIGGLGNPVLSLPLITRAYVSLDEMLQAYGCGEGDGFIERDPDQPFDERQKEVCAFWTKKLVEAGHHERIATWCMQQHFTYLWVLEAEGDRIFVKYEREAAAREPTDPA